MADVVITALVNEANANAQTKGFYSLPRWNGGAGHGGHEFNEYRHAITNEQLLHACIELGEAAQIFRKTGQFSDELLEELADVFIVLADLIGRYDLDQRFADMLVAKLFKNQQRPHAYGNAQAQVQAEGAAANVQL